MKRIAIFAAGFVSIASFAISASAFALTPADQYGSAATPVAAGRVIDVTSATRYVNVKHGEAVTFRENGKSVTWYFDGIAPSFALSRILPDAQGVQVYVEAEVLS